MVLLSRLFGHRVLYLFCTQMEGNLTEGDERCVVVWSIDNPLTDVLEHWLLLSLLYCLLAKVISAFLRSISMKQHVRERCSEATLLGISSAVCLYLCWSEVRPRRDVFRMENTLVGIFTQKRLFDENIYSDGSLGVLAIVTALLLHSASVSWSTYGLSLELIKKTALVAFYVSAHNLRFRYLGPMATFVSAVMEMPLQLTRVVCCFEQKVTILTVLTKLTFVVYTFVWTLVIGSLMPRFFLKPSMELDVVPSKAVPTYLLIGSLYVFYVLEVVTMPLVKMLLHSVIPMDAMVRMSLLERVLIPPSARLLHDLRELRARKLQSRAARKELELRHGASSKTRDLYKSLRMIMAVKKHIRNHRQAKLLKQSEESESSTSLDESHGETPLQLSETGTLPL